ncbi:MAG: heterodisulfide reductase-related iron-sulfur binding cluster [Desulfobacterota bacterium]|nr:heterodisulfide reductase-related iron-sulfur binding cluster [Thermodesulfobacteriota bacterium]MDW8002438.1 (Fe-S)-binding protein [Deltaproteobacteria bacterium]
MSQKEVVIFAIVLTIAIFSFALSVTRLIRFIRIGQKEQRINKDLTKRLISTIWHVFGQRCALREPFGINHFFLFWGFMILIIANVEFLIGGLFPGFSLVLFGPYIYNVLLVAFDIVSLIVLICVAFAIFRRLVLKPSHIDYKSKDALLILGLVAGLMLAFFGTHGAEIAQGKKEAHFMPISENLVAPLLLSFFSDSLSVFERICWWFHAMILLFFLNYVPYSKHLHILTSIPNIFFRSFELIKTVPREEFRRGKRFGVSRVDQFTWKDLLDFTSCTECGRCTSNCPAYLTKKPLNPRIVIYKGKMNLIWNGDRIRYKAPEAELVPLIGKDEDHPATIGVESIWSCTTCAACMGNCPVFIEHVPKIIKMRRHLVENLCDFPQELIVLFEGMEQRFNPWGMAPSERIKWAKGLDVKVLSQEVQAEYLFFVGCAGSFDSRTKRVAVSVADTLNHMGVDFGILGVEEKCCGDSARRLGNEYLFEKLAIQNVETFKKYNVKKIICYCPHCYSTLKNDYKQYGLELEVFHYTEVIWDNLKAIELDPTKIKHLGKIIFHDPCYLGRYNGIYEAPRNLLKKAVGGRIYEMDRNYDKSFCCGAGGGRMWMEEDPEKRVNIERTKEALSKNPQTIAVSCPYCMTMFEDGLKDLNVSGKVRVFDVAEIVAMASK